MSSKLYKVRCSYCNCKIERRILCDLYICFNCKAQAKRSRAMKKKSPFWDVRYKFMPEYQLPTLKK